MLQVLRQEAFHLKEEKEGLGRRTHFFLSHPSLHLFGQLIHNGEDNLCQSTDSNVNLIQILIYLNICGLLALTHKSKQY